MTRFRPEHESISTRAAGYGRRSPADRHIEGDRMSRLPFLAVAAMVLAALLTVSAPASAAPARCDWRTEYTRTLAELHEDLSLWRVEFAGNNDDGQRLGGRGGEGGAIVDPAVPCEYVADVVRHEHMHLQQVRMASGSWALATMVFGAHRMEITADCASMLAGSRYTPYVDRAGGCTERDLRDARQLVDYNHQP